MFSFLLSRRRGKEFAIEKEAGGRTYRNGALSSGKAREGHNSNGRESHDELIFN